MPEVRILCDVAGPHFLWEAGDIVAMTPEQAAVYADGVRGEVVRPQPTIETPERAMRAEQTRLRR